MQASRAKAMDRRDLGLGAEDAAARHLELLGYLIVGRNYRCKQGEVDLIAEHRDMLCFVEVRMRSHGVWGDPAATVSFRKQRRVVYAALHYLHLHPAPDRMVRFDVVSVVGRGEGALLEHIPNAFDAGM